MKKNHRPLALGLILALGSQSCSKPENSTTDTTLPATSAFRLGEGIDLVSQSYSGLCVDFVLDTAANPSDERPEGTEAALSVHRIQNQREFSDAMSVSAQASISGAIAAASGNVVFSRKQKFNSKYTYLMISTSVALPARRARALKLTDFAEKKLLNEGPEAFRLMCGDEYTAAIFDGGDMHILVEIQSDTKEQQEKAQATFSLQGTFYSAAADRDAEVKEKLKDLKIRYEVVKNGTTANFPSFNDAMQDALTFPSQVIAARGQIQRIDGLSYYRAGTPPGVVLFDSTPIQSIMSQLGNLDFETRTNLDAAESVINSPSDFQNPDVPALTQYKQTASNYLIKIVDAAKTCTANFQNCYIPPSIAPPVLPQRKGHSSLTLTFSETHDSGYGHGTVPVSIEPVKGVRLLNAFDFKYLNEDHHIQTIGIDSGAAPSVTFADANGDDDFEFHVTWIDLQDQGIITGLAKNANCRGTCEELLNPPSPDHVFVLSGYKLSFSNSDHHIRELEISESSGKLKVTYADVNADDDFSYEVNYAWVPRSLLVHSDRMVKGQGSGTQLSEVADAGRRLIQGFHVVYLTKNEVLARQPITRTDNHLKDFAINHLSPNGENLLARFGDNDTEDDFFMFSASYSTLRQ